MGGSNEEPDQSNQPSQRDLPHRLADDQFYQALASLQRRRLLYYLLEEEHQTVEELTTVISGWEATTTGAMITQTDRANLHLELIHNHLPRLADAGLIDYEPPDDVVTLRPLHPQVKDIIRQSIEATQPDET